jgi:hypothetical protein
MMFGFNMPEELLKRRGQPAFYWGARAIFTPGKKNPIDMLPDRQSRMPEGVQHPILMPWLNSEAMPWLIKEIDKQGIWIDSDKVLVYHRSDAENFTLMASPLSSHGYLYIGAWRYNPENCAYELKAPTEGKKWTGQTIPKIGDRVICKINTLGPGVVLDYFYEHGYQGVRVLLNDETRPEWHKKQNPGDPTAMVFGAEISIK